MNFGANLVIAGVAGGVTQGRDFRSGDIKERVTGWVRVNAASKKFLS